MKKILIADDSVLSRMLLKQVILEAAPDSEIREVAYGDEALRVLREFVADLVLLDYNMPGLNGLDTAIAIHQQAPAVRIALVTANIQSSLRQQMRQSGILFAGLIEKPITRQTREQIVRLLAY